MNMRRLILYLGAAIATFVIGVNGHLAYVGRINDTTELRISLAEAIAGCEKALVQTLPLDITLCILKQKNAKRSFM
jgi:hypothetical protein